MRATLVLLVLCVFAASASAATMTPLSDAGLSAISAGNGDGGELEIEIDVDEQGQMYVSALNLINAGGPVQVGTNQLVASANIAAVVGSQIQQVVTNQIDDACSVCEFEEVDLEVDIDDQGQQFASALNLINTTGAAQVGTNIVALSGGSAALVNNSSVTQLVVNSYSGD